MGKKKATGVKSEAGAQAPRCPVENCKNRLTEDKKAQCAQCGKSVCKLHIYPLDHGCTAGAEQEQQKKKAAASGGLVVMSSNKASAAKAVDPDAKKKAAARDDELLAALVAAEPAHVLKELLAFGAANARYEDSIAVRALSSESKAVSKAFYGPVAKGVAETAAAQGELQTLASHLSAHLDRASQLPQPPSGVEEQRSVGVAVLFATLMDLDAPPAAADPCGAAALELGLALVRGAGGDKLAKAGADQLLRRVARARWAGGADFDEACWPVLGALLDDALNAAEDDDARRNGSAAGAAAVAGAVGHALCADRVVQERLAQVLSEKGRDGARVLGCMRVVTLLCKEWGAAVVPHLQPVDFIPSALFDIYDTVPAGARAQTKKALVAIVDHLGPRGVRTCVPRLLEALEGGAWRVKALALALLGQLGRRRASQLFRELPLLIPAVMECVRDTKKQVADAASEALDDLGGLISNAETIKLLPWLLRALKDPEQVELCLDELMDTTFVNSVDAQSLAFIIPIVLRGLREGAADVKLKGCVTAGNVCSLVADVHDMRPYYTLLLPELKKLTDHSRPRVREMAVRAKQSLQEDLSLSRRRSSNSAGGSGAASAARHASVRKSSAAVANSIGGSHAGNGGGALASDARAVEALAGALEATGARAELSDVVFEYALSTCKMLLFDVLEDVDPEMPRRLVRQRVSVLMDEAVLPLAADMRPAGAARALADASTDAVMGALWTAQGKQAEDDGADGSGERDYIVYIPSIILAFASRVLLKRAGLFLERGRRYSVVGLNGSGKSTLLTRVAARDIDGFPADVSVYFVEHEIMEEDQNLSVLGYMQRDLDGAGARVASPGPGGSVASGGKRSKASGGKAGKGGKDRVRALAADDDDGGAAINVDKSEARLVAVLKEVGFTEALQQQAVAALSGGWRMRLAIARSMLYLPDLLLLDEPTNHLDRAALEWLQGYLAGLTKTTIVLVSHDYDFVDYVSTDIIHLADQKLTYYPFGFSAFQKERPEIVAALPRKDDAKPPPAPGAADPADADGAAQAEAVAEGAAAAPQQLSAIELMAAAASGEEGAAALTSGIKPINFPEGCKLDGIAHRGKPIALLGNVSYSYPGTDKLVFTDVTVKLTLNSRVAILGKNGAGKSTLLKLLVGELELDEKRGHSGKFWRHHNLRTAYIAQHSMHHLEDHIEMTPCQYIQARFYEGQDKEASKMITVKLTEDDEAAMRESGEINEIMSRVARSKKLFYEVRKCGRNEKDHSKDFRSLDELQRMSLDSPHIMKLVRLFDEKLKFAASGVDLRPVTTPEMIKHLAEFGIDAEIAQRKVRWMSGGQRARLVLAAAMWTRPHMIILDEPTNYLDQDTVAALTFALKNFRGSVVLISHHEGFVHAVAKEHWHISEGRVRVENLKQAA